MSSPKLTTSAFTLIELLLVIGILGILTGIVIFSFQKFSRVQSVDKDTETVLETLRLASAQTRDGQNQSQYGVHFSSSSVVLFAGTSYSAGAAGNLVYPLHSGDTILSTNLSGGGSAVIFQRLTGATADYGTVTISSMTASTSNNVIIYSTGTIAGPPSI